MVSMFLSRAWQIWTQLLRFKYFRVARKYQIFIRLRILIFLISIIWTDFWRWKVLTLILLISERSSHFETEAVDTIENRKLNDGASYATCSHNRNPPPQSQSEVANNSNNQSCRCYYAFIKPIMQQIHYEISENCKTFKKIVDSKYFGHGIMIAILINTSSMGIGTVETLILRLFA